MFKLLGFDYHSIYNQIILQFNFDSRVINSSPNEGEFLKRRFLDGEWCLPLATQNN